MVAPSKELFKKVMGIDLMRTYISDGQEVERNLWINDDYIVWNDVPYTDEVSIFEFAFKIKEWAEIHGYILSSSIGLCDIAISRNVKWIWNESADTEVEAIIKAGEWILKDSKEM